MYKIQNCVMMACYWGWVICLICEGGCLWEEVIYVKIQGCFIIDLVEMLVDELFDYLCSLELNEYD